MSKLVFNRDGGKTDEFGHLLGLARSMQGEVIEGLLVAANGSPNMTVNVPIGTAMIPTSSGGTAYKYFVGLDATESVAITTANPSNPRNDLIVLYVDVAVTASQSYTNNSNNMLKLAAVAGTPAASPADPSIANIQAAIGAANPYIILARVVVGAGVTQINNGNITSLRNIVRDNDEISKRVYPVGSVYINASVSTNPATLLGFGTWTAFGSSRVLVGVDTSQTEFDTLGKTGGAKTHTLTVNEIPPHSHTINGSIAHSNGSTYPGVTDDFSQPRYIQTQNQGGGAAHNNLQPYITVYMWLRTA